MNISNLIILVCLTLASTAVSQKSVVNNLSKLLCCGNIALFFANSSRATPRPNVEKMSQASSSDSSSFMYYERLNPHASTTRAPHRPPPELSSNPLHQSYYLSNHKMDTTSEPRSDHHYVPKDHVSQVESDRPFGSRISGNEITGPSNIAAYENVHYNKTHNQDDEDNAFFNNLKDNLKTMNSAIDDGLNEKILEVVHNDANAFEAHSTPKQEVNDAPEVAFQTDNDHDDDDDGPGEQYKHKQQQQQQQLDYGNWQPMSDKDAHKYERSVVIAPVQTLHHKDDMPDMEGLLKSVRDEQFMAAGEYDKDGKKHYSINIPPNHEPIIVRFNTYSTPIKTIQNHHKSKPQTKHLVTKEKPDRIVHTIKKVVINEINEVIQPIRKWKQIVQPVKETIKTHIATPGHHHQHGDYHLSSAPGNNQPRNFPLYSASPKKQSNRASFPYQTSSTQSQISLNNGKYPSYKNNVGIDPDVQSIIQELINSPDVLESGPHHHHHHSHHENSNPPTVNLPLSSSKSAIYVESPRNVSKSTNYSSKTPSMLSVNTIYKIYTNLTKNKQKDIAASLGKVIKQFTKRDNPHNATSNVASKQFNRINQQLSLLGKSSKHSAEYESS